MMKLISFSLVFILLLACSGHQQKAKSFEVRLLAEKFVSNPKKEGKDVFETLNGDIKIVDKKIFLNNTSLKNIKKVKTKEGKVSIHFEFTKRGGQQLKQLTTEYKGKREMAFIVDDIIIAAFPIYYIIKDGQAILEGRFTEAEVDSIVEGLKRK